MPDPTKKGKKEIKGTKKKLLVPKEGKKKIKQMTPADFVEKKPNSTDSLAQWMYKNDKRTNYADIAQASNKKWGDIDVSKFDIMKERTVNAPKARKKYGIQMQGKTPIMKQILANQEGLQKMTKTEKGREAVKNMGFTKDVDGGMLMKKDYAAMMGGYKAPLKKAALYTKNPYTVGTPPYAEWERKNNPAKETESFGVNGKLIPKEKMKEYNDTRKLRLEEQAWQKRFRKGTGAYEGTYVDRQTGERTRGPVPKFRRKG